MAVPAAGLSLSSSVLRDFVAFLESFLLNDYQPVQIHLTEPSKKEGNFIFSQTAQALFSRVPGNAKATPPIWTAPKPSQVQLVGSCGAELGPPAFARNLDLAFELPADALDKRDYLNYRCVGCLRTWAPFVPSNLNDQVHAFRGSFAPLQRTCDFLRIAAFSVTLRNAPDWWTLCIASCWQRWLPQNCLRSGNGPVYAETG